MDDWRCYVCNGGRLFTYMDCIYCWIVVFRFVEINIDVFPLRERELIERTGSSSVPQIFFNEKLFGGLVVLNSLRNSGMLEDKLKELLAKKCPANVPAPPVYGFDDPEEDRVDDLVKIVGILRQRLPIQDRLMKMKLVKNCFSGAEMVEVIMKHYVGCERTKVTFLLWFLRLWFNHMMKLICFCVRHKTSI